MKFNLSDIKNEVVNGKRTRSIVNELENRVVEYTFSNIKSKFGKEFLYDYTTNDYIYINTIIDKFIKKYDKKFNNHAFKDCDNFYYIENKEFFIPLEKNTFIYVATGNTINKNKFQSNSRNTYHGNRSLYLYIFGKNCNKYIREFYLTLKSVKDNNADGVGIYIVDKERYSSPYDPTDNNRTSLYITYDVVRYRELDTLFYSNGEKKEICDHINSFNNNENFFNERQLLYKTGILLYGEPGTGKSSLVKALATKYKREIVSINVSNIDGIDLNKLTSSINAETKEKYIILLEDIDTLFLDRSKEETTREDRAIINKLLQFLDSNTSPNNVIFIATTNHKDRLDEALLREGRFDLKVKIKPLRRREAIDFCKSFGLNETDTVDILNTIDSESNTYDIYNQSKLQVRILSKIKNKDVNEIENIYCESEVNES